MSTIRLPLKYKAVARVLLDAGFSLTRHSGDHDIYTHPDGRLAVLAFRKGGTVSKTSAATALRTARGQRPRFCGQPHHKEGR